MSNNFCYLENLETAIGTLSRERLEKHNFWREIRHTGFLILVVLSSVPTLPVPQHAKEELKVWQNPITALLFFIELSYMYKSKIIS